MRGQFLRSLPSSLLSAEDSAARDRIVAHMGKIGDPARTVVTVESTGKHSGKGAIVTAGTGREVDGHMRVVSACAEGKTAGEAICAVGLMLGVSL